MKTRKFRTIGAAALAVCIFLSSLTLLHVLAVSESVVAEAVITGVKAIEGRNKEEADRFNDIQPNGFSNQVKLIDKNTAEHFDVTGAGTDAYVGLKFDFGTYYEIDEITVWTKNINGKYCVTEYTAFAATAEDKLYTGAGILGKKRLETTLGTNESTPLTLTLDQPVRAQYVVVIFTDMTEDNTPRITEADIKGTLSDVKPDKNILLGENNLTENQIIPSGISATDSTFQTVNPVSNYGTGNFNILTDGKFDKAMDMYGGIPDPPGGYIRGVLIDLKGYYDVSKFVVSLPNVTNDILVKEIYGFAAEDLSSLYTSKLWEVTGNSSKKITKSIEPVKKVRYLAFFFRVTGNPVGGYPRIQEIEVFGKARPSDEQPASNILITANVTPMPRYDADGKFNSAFLIPMYPKDVENDPEGEKVEGFASMVKDKISLAGFADGNTSTMVQIYGGMPDSPMQRGRPIVVYDLGGYYDITGVSAYVGAAIQQVRIYASGSMEKLSYYDNLIYADEEDSTATLREITLDAPKKVKYVAFCLAKSSAGWQASEFEVYGTLSADQENGPVESDDPKYPSEGGSEGPVESDNLLFQQIPVTLGTEKNNDPYTLNAIGGPEGWLTMLTDGIVKDSDGFYQSSQLWGSDNAKNGANFVLVYDLMAYYDLSSVGIFAAPFPGDQLMTGWEAYAGTDEMTLFGEANKIASANVTEEALHTSVDVSPKGIRYIGFRLKQKDKEYGAMRICEIEAFGEKVGDIQEEVPGGKGSIALTNAAYGVTATVYFLDSENQLNWDASLKITPVEDDELKRVVYEGMDKRFVAELIYETDIVDAGGSSIDTEGRRIEITWPIPESLSAKPVKLALIDGTQSELVDTTEADNKLEFETTVLHTYAFVSRDSTAYTGEDSEKSPSTAGYFTGGAALAILIGCVVLVILSKRNTKLAGMIFGNRKKKIMSAASMVLVFTVTLASAFAMLTAMPVSAHMDGAGTAEDPYKIYSAEDLAQLALDVQGGTAYAETYFELKADIDLTDYLSSGGDGWNAGAGWLPIGTSDAANMAAPSTGNSKPFQGVFDGKWHTVSGLWMNRPDAAGVGLFGMIQDAKISNLNVIIDNTASAAMNSGNAGVTATAGVGINGLHHVGGLVGATLTSASDACIITNCSVTMADTAKTAVASYGQRGSNMSNTGGFIGANGGPSGNTTGAVISHSYSAVNVFGIIGAVGGFAGLNGTNSRIETSFATGAVRTNGTYAGGFAGRVASTRSHIFDCYATGDVSGTRSGGFVGCIQVTSSSIVIRNSYSTGKVTGTESKGFVGYNHAGAPLSANCGIFDSFFLQDTDVNEGLAGTFTIPSGFTDNAGTDIDVSALGDGWFRTPATFAEWDTDIWHLTDGAYPMLFKNITVTPKLGQGKEYDGEPVNPADIELQVTGAPAGFVLNGVPAILNNSAGKGEYEILFGTITDAMNPGYHITFTTGVKYIITGIVIDVTPVAGQSMTYTGSAPSSIAYTVSPELPMAGALALKDSAVNAGDHDIVLGTLAVDSPEAANYTLRLADETYRINKATATVTPDSGQSSTYTGLAPSDIAYTVSPAALVPQGTLALENAAVNAGTHKIVQGTLTLSAADMQNYQLSFISNVDYLINKQIVTVTPNSNQGKTHDGTTAQNIAYQAEPDVPMTGSLQLEGNTADIGSHNIVQGTLNTADTQNYEISFVGDVKYVIAAKTVTVTPKPNQSKSYDGTTAEGIEYETDNDTISFTGSLALEENASAAGTYKIVAGTLQAEGLYVMALTPNVEYTILPAAITVTPSGLQSKAYDGGSAANIAYTLTSGTLYAGDILTGSLELEGQAKNAGSHTIVKGTLANPNYTITVTPDVKFTITPMELTVTPDADQSKVYDGNTASSITYAISGGAFLTGDEPAGSLALKDAAKTAGEHEIVLGTLAHPNYNLSVEAGVLYKIEKKAITVQPAAGQTKVYDGQLPAEIAYTVLDGGLVEGDILSGALALEGGAAEAGVHAIVLGTLANPNYEITLEAGTYEITPKPGAGESSVPGTSSLPDTEESVPAGSAPGEAQVDTGAQLAPFVLAVLAALCAAAVIVMRRRKASAGR